MTKRLLNAAALVLSVVLIAGCARPTPTATEDPATLTSPPTSTSDPTAEEQTVDDSAGGPVSMPLPGDDWGYPSPFGFYSRGPGYIRMSLLFDTLTWKDEEGVIPWLAEAWTVSDDGTKWTFDLVGDVTWHDGEPLTAEDVAFTLEYFKSHQGAFKWSWPVGKIESAEVLGEGKVALHLSDAIAGAHEALIGSLPIIPKHVWERVDDPAKLTSDEAVIGSGPFTLAEYSKDEGRYVYEMNTAYFQGAPTVDELTFIKVENQALALETDTVDCADFWGKEIEAVEAFEGDEAYGIIDGPSFWVLQTIFNTQRAPFDDVELRRAVAHAIDRQRIVDQVTHGGAIAANLGILSPHTDWHNPDLPSYDHDPEEAQAMLEEAGATDLSVRLITTAGFAREAELVQADLEAVGIEVEVQTGDYSTVDGLLREGNFDLAINGHGGIANPAMLETPTWPAAVYQNAAYDELYQRQAAAVDDEERLEVVRELQEMVAEDLPVLTLYHPKMWTVFDAGVLDTWFYTQGGVGFGIPIAMNKLIFLPPTASERAEAPDGEGETSSSDTTPESASSEGEAGSDVPQILTIGLGRDLYDGPDEWYYLHGSLAVWEPLVILDNDMVAQPVLATSWEANEDGTEWTFRLREGVTFHDGTPFNADAVLLNVPKLQEEYSTTLPGLDSLEKVDEYTVKFLMSEPTPNLPQLIAYFSSAMISPNALGEDGRPTGPVGTGPFVFEEYIEDDSIILTRNEDYWGGPAKLEQVTFKYIPEATTRLAALQTGEIDAIADVGSLQPEQASIVEDAEDLVLHEQGVATSHYLTFNSGKPPFDDVRLRQAVSKAVDRQGLVDTTLYGFGDPGVSVITPRAAEWVRTDTAPEYDMERAASLAQEALGSDRVEAKLILHSGLLGRWPYENISQILQATLVSMGIDVTIETMEGGAWSEALKNGEYDLTMMPYTLMTGDPDFFMGEWVYSEGGLNQRRSYGYANERADELILAAQSEMDVAERKAMYDELQAIVAEDVPFTPLYHEATIYATRDNVKDLRLDVQFKPSIDEAYLAAE